MSGKIIPAIAAAVLLLSAGVASAQTTSQRHYKEPKRYYNVVPADPAPTTVPQGYTSQPDPANSTIRDAWPQNGTAW